MAATITAAATAIKTGRIAMDGTGGNVTAVTVAGMWRRITVSFTSSAEAAEDGYLVQDGTVADGAAKGNNWLRVPLGQALEIRLIPRGSVDASSVIMLAGTTASGYAHYVVER